MIPEGIKKLLLFTQVFLEKSWEYIYVKLTKNSLETIPLAQIQARFV